MKGFLKFALVFSLLFCSLTGQVFAADFSGNGTSSSPYLIQDEDDLKKLASNVNSGNSYSGKSFKLTADIALSGMWQPIGSSSRPFSGTFYGDGHSISGISVLGGNAGLFGKLKNATVKDLYVSMGAVSITYNSETYTGSVAGIAENSTIDGCVVSGSMARIANSTFVMGGIVGKMTGGTVKNCVSQASMNVSFGAMMGIKLHVGDLVGEMENSAVITDSGVSGNVSVTAIRGGEASAEYDVCTGGIAGYVGAGCKIKNSYSSCSASFQGQNVLPKSGNMVGMLDGALEGCYSSSMPSTASKAVYGELGENGSVKNVYYRRIFGAENITGTECGTFTSSTSNVTPNTGASFASASLLSLLNKNTSCDWIVSDYANGGYPVQKKNTVNIKVTTGANGTSSPDGTAVYQKGDTAIITLEPDENYSVASVTIDGNASAAEETVSISALMKDHAVHAEFSPNDLVIRASATAYGTISPSGEVLVKADSSITFTITANKGCHIKEIIVDGKSVPITTKYTFSDVNDTHYITVYFEENSPGSNQGPINGGAGSGTGNNPGGNNPGTGNNPGGNNSGIGNIPGIGGNTGVGGNTGNTGNPGFDLPDSFETDENGQTVSPDETNIPADETDENGNAVTDGETEKGTVSKKPSQTAPVRDEEPKENDNSKILFIAGGALAGLLLIVGIVVAVKRARS